MNLDRETTTGHAPVVDAAAHAWVVNDPRFPVDPDVASCPDNLPVYDESAEQLLTRMRNYGIDQTVISHVCYYGRDNRYSAHCVSAYPEKFTGVGLLVGYRMHSPGDPENPALLERLMRDDGLSGLRLSPIYGFCQNSGHEPISGRIEQGLAATVMQPTPPAESSICR